jgi:DNA replication protein DnaC
MDRAIREGEARRASQRRAEVVQALATKLGRRYSPARATLATYRVKYQEQSEALHLLTPVATDPANAGNLVLYGSVGTGKDHLLAALLYAAAHAGLSAAWVNGQEVYSRFRDAMDTKTSEASLMADFTRPDVLGISDPIPPVVDPNKPAAWRTELLFRVLDARYRDMKVTWVTCNAEDPKDAAAKLSEPVFDRLKDGAVLVPCFWPSFREHKK